MKLKIYTTRFFLALLFLQFTNTLLAITPKWLPDNCSAPSATVVYVKWNATGANNGTSWANAYTDLQTAISNTTSGQIWVATGTYKPTSGSDRSTAFILKNNVAIYGGFNGTETILCNRNISANETTLSGDLNNDDGPNFVNNSENSYHVVNNNNNGLNSTAILNGFTITGGNANNSNSGGGIINESSSPSLVNLKIMYNKAASYGGGMFNYNATPMMDTIYFIGNVSNAYGGGLAILTNSPQVTSIANSYFIQNIGTYGAGVFNAGNVVFEKVVFAENAASESGGAISISDLSSVTFNNSLFLNNSAVNFGGAISNNFATLVLKSSTITGNTTTSGISQGLYLSNDSTTTIVNAIIWNGNSSSSSILTSFSSVQNITYSTIEGGFVGTGNLSTNPLFVNASNPIGADDLWATADDGLKLQGNSPSRNSGNNADVSGITDITNQTRIGNTTVDRGAYETISLGRIYVNKLATGLNNGTTWTDAFTDLQSAIAIALYGDEIWVAKGTYKPTSGSDRAMAFIMKNNVAIYGGFNGTETLLSSRNISVNETILSGDLNNNDGPNFTNYEDNSYHVVYNNDNGLSNTAILNGFTISGGNANEFSSLRNEGGGIFNRLSSSASYVNLKLINNKAISYGGGMYVESSTPSLNTIYFIGNDSGTLGGGLANISGIPDVLSVTNCNFIQNSSAFGGGCNTIGNVTFEKVVFSENIARASGGAVANRLDNQSTMSFNNCVFVNNNATSSGGAIFNSSGIVNLKSSTITGNTVTNETTSLGLMLSNTTTTTITNSIVWNGSASDASILAETGANATVSYSTVEGGYTGTGNLSSNPLFINASNPIGVDNIWATADDGLKLQGTSTSRNSGNNADVSGITDITNQTRIGNTTVDRGAYETISLGRIYVNKLATGLNNGTTWTDAFTNLQNAIAIALSGDEIWVAKGTYKPTSGTDRSVSFVLKDGVKMYGGFNATETNLSQRDWNSNPTILTGDIGLFEDPNDNSKNIVTANSIGATSIFDGFIMEKAYFLATDTGISGAVSIQQSPMVLKNLKIRNNFNDNSNGTGGMYIKDSDGIVFFNNEIERNEAPFAGLLIENTSINIENCSFILNYGIEAGGLSVNNTNETVRLINTIFSKNGAINKGGAISLALGTTNTEIINCTFEGNEIQSPLATSGAAISIASNNTVMLANSIFYNNGYDSQNTIVTSGLGSDIVNNGTLNIKNSILQSSLTCTACLTTGTNPLFVDAADIYGADNILGTADDGLKPQNTSLAINAGDNSSVTGIISDIAGYARIQNTTVDLGAYELGGLLSINEFQMTSSLKIYPNPTKDILKLSNKEKIINIKVYAILGNEVLSKEINALEGEIDLSNLTKGTYLLQVISKEKSIFNKVIKE